MLASYGFFVSVGGVPLFVPAVVVCVVWVVAEVSGAADVVAVVVLTVVDVSGAAAGVAELVVCVVVSGGVAGSWSFFPKSQAMLPSTSNPAAINVIFFMYNLLVHT